jgi:hypothetical protein
MDSVTRALWPRSATGPAEAMRSKRPLSDRVKIHLWRVKVVDPSMSAVTAVLTEQARRAAKVAGRRTVAADLSFGSVPFTRRFRRRLLACGILASALWVTTDVLAGTLSEDYSFVSRSISELSAPGASTRSLVVPLDLIYDLLMVAFGLAVWGTGDKRALRLTAVMIVGSAVLGALAVLFFPMHPGEPTRTFANTVNLALMAPSTFCFLLAIGFGAAAFRTWFRLYSIGTLAAYSVLTILGILLGSRNGERASVGVQERTMVFGYLLWVVMLAIVLLRAEDRPGWGCG